MLTFTMGWILLLLTLLSYHSGVNSQPPWIQPASQSVPLGETAKLSCTINNDGHYVYWYQQKPGQAPRFLHCAQCSRGEGIPDRFTASVSGSVAYLTITEVQAGDEAGYYCAKWYTSGDQWVFGGGTTLIVIDPNHPTSPPNVHLFPPSSEEKESKNKATLVCLVDSFTPPDITIAWEADGAAVSNGVETTKPTKLNDKYVASSYLTLTPTDWEGHQSVSCKVTHKGTDYVKSVSHSKCP